MAFFLHAKVTAQITVAGSSSFERDGCWHAMRAIGRALGIAPAARDAPAADRCFLGLQIKPLGVFVWAGVLTLSSG